MAETKFTPGPWSIEKPFDEPGTYITCANRRTSNPLVCKLHPVNIDANAHLIAAAPDLYEALELILELRGKELGEWLLTLNAKHLTLKEYAQAALAKARGEEIDTD